MAGVPKPLKNVVYLVNFILGGSNTEEGKKRREESQEKDDTDDISGGIVLRKSKSDVASLRRTRSYRRSNTNPTNEIISKSYAG